MKITRNHCRVALATPLRQRGQTTTEYIVATLAVILLLAVIPIPGLGGPPQSVIGWLITVLHTWWMNFTFLISLP